MTYVTGVIQQTKISNYLISISVITMMIYCITFILHRRKLYMHTRNIPGPAAIPFIGSLFLLQNSFNESMRKLAMHLSAFSVVMKIWIGTRVYIFLLKAEYIETILHHPNFIEKNDFYDVLTEIVGDGLINLPAKSWRIHRKKLSPSFNQRMLDSFVEIFVQKSEIFVDKLKEVVGQPGIDLYSLTSRLTLDTICETALGVNMNVQASDNNLGEQLEILSSIVTRRVASLWYRIFWKFFISKKTFKLIVQEINRTIQEVIDKQVTMNEFMKRNQSTTEAEIEESTLKRKSILDCMISDTSFSREEMTSEVKMFMLAGTETTACTLCYIFVMLGIYPEVQEKVYEEIIEVIGPDRPVEASDISQLKYTDRVIKETMRLFPIGKYMARRVISDYDLGNGVILPENSNVIVPVLHTHRNPLYWKDPLKFEPDRFLPNELSKRKTIGYFPFSLGPRNCIGGRYALSSMKTILATTLRQFKVFSEYKSAESIILKPDIMVKMVHGPKVSFELR